MYYYKQLLCTYLYLFQRHKIENIIHKNIIYELFITHDFEGGTFTYERNYITDRNNIIIFRNISYGKDFLFSIENPALKKKVYIRPNKLMSFFESQTFYLITINSFVKNISFEVIINILKKYNEKNRDVLIKYNVHDYHSICPNYVLINNNQYCNIECDKKTCLFDKLIVMETMNIKRWREIWNGFFSFVSEIVCFSQSSKDIIQKVYPDIGKKITVIPHSMSYCNFTPIDITGLNFHIGIIGTLTNQLKGLSVVKDFLKYTKKEKIKVSIIGKMRFWDKLYSPYIVYRNSYRNIELQSIIEQEKITNILFPTICPETFSFLISELMAMNMPVVCFNIGAQAEKIKNYPRGCICQSTNSKDILVSLKKQYADITMFNT